MRLPSCLNEPTQQARFAERSQERRGLLAAPPRFETAERIRRASLRIIICSCFGGVVASAARIPARWRNRRVFTVTDHCRGIESVRTPRRGLGIPCACRSARRCPAFV
ncbi:hypothetical protein MRX96_009551 [Rhipicephalus microplus]